jgi:hypothetical protein
MKSLKQIREEYDNIVLDQVESLPEEIMLEGLKPVSTASPIPSAKEMPIMLVFRRVQYRIFPNKQVVALYYSNMINKYLSIPFGPDGNVNLSEAVVIEPEMLEEDWQKVNRRDKTDGLSQAAVNAYRRENPGSKLQTAVTEKNPSGKRAKRRLSFCRRMKGMKKRLTSAKTARDPDSRINKALRRWNCEESFKERLQSIREARGYNVGDAAWDVASFVPGPIGAVASGVSAKRSLERGDKVSAALDAAGAVPLLGYGSKVAKLGKLAKGALTARKAAKTADVASTASKVGKVGKVGSVVSKVGKVSKLAGAAANVGKALLNPLEGSKQLGQSKAAQANIKKGSSSTKPTDEYTPVQRTKLHQAQMKENKISDIRDMVNEGVGNMNLEINGRTVTLNNGMAKRILEVYDSVNSKNKKIVENMLNEDLESFKRLLTFSIKA